MNPVRPRSPVPWAIAIVVVLTAFGLLLRWWGPINPALATSQQLASGDGSGSSEPHPATNFVSPVISRDGVVRVEVAVENHSHSDVELTATRLHRGAATSGRDWPTMTTVGVPKRLEAGGRTTVTASLDFVRVCAAHPIAERTFAVLVDAETTSGVTKTVNDKRLVTISCATQIMPAAGPPPPDAEAAKRGVEEAFTSVYELATPFAERRALIDDPSGLDPLVDKVTNTFLPGGPRASLRIEMGEVVFTSPTEAAVPFALDLDGSDPIRLTEEIGHARLVDGTWKVTRATVCTDLGHLGYDCPGF